MSVLPPVRAVKLPNKMILCVIFFTELPNTMISDLCVDHFPPVRAAPPPRIVVCSAEDDHGHWIQWL